jgi:hypothetical protein
MQYLHSFGGHNAYYRSALSAFWHTRCGGYTFAYLDRPEDVPFIGVAICSPKDRYSRRVGRARAEARLHRLGDLFSLAEIEDGNFGVINIPQIRGGLAADLQSAALLDALIFMEDRWPKLAEHRVVNFPALEADNG